MANIINRPIIDGEVTAFPCSFKHNKDVLRVYFYFQSTDKDINEDYIFAAVAKGGQYQYLLGTAYEPFKVWRDSENLIYPDRRYIEIPSALVKGDLVNKGEEGTFPLNTAFNVQLMTLSNACVKDLDSNFFDILQNRIWYRDQFTQYNDWINNLLSDFNSEYHSAWSRPVSFLPIAQPILTTWGSLTAAQVETSQSLTEDEAVEHLLDNKNLNEQEFDPGDKYIFKCELSFDTHNNIDLQENDQLQGYEVQLFGISNKEDTVGISLDDKTTVTGYATRVQLETTKGQTYLDTKWDKTKRLFHHTLNYNFLEGGFAAYELEITYYTTKNYKETVTYLFKAQSVEEEKEAKHQYLTLKNLVCTPIEDRGVVNITAEIYDSRQTPKHELGVIVIERAEDINAGALTQRRLKWYPCYEANIYTSLEGVTSINIDDASVEPGVFYKYRVRFKIWRNADKQYVYATNENELTYLETPESDPPVILFVEDIFLATRDLTLKIKYNPELSNYKRNVVDAITPTLGGSYPFMRRNGAQKYRTFTLGGLISYNAELYEPKISDSAESNGDSIGQKWNSQAADDKFYQSLFIKSNSDAWQTLQRYDTLATNGNIDKEQKRVLYERFFRNMVMDFLYDDQVLLFKSLPEGNIFIRLSNVQLTPNKTLDRHIYSFTATATEVLEANSENYLKYFSPPVTSVESAVQNIYLVAGYYQYKDGVLYIGKDTTGNNYTGVSPDGQGYLVSSTWNRDGAQDGYTTIDLHLETRKAETEWEG